MYYTGVCYNVSFFPVFYYNSNYFVTKSYKIFYFHFPFLGVGRIKKGWGWGSGRQTESQICVSSFTNHNFVWRCLISEKHRLFEYGFNIFFHPLLLWLLKSYTIQNPGSFLFFLQDILFPHKLHKEKCI